MLRTWSHDLIKLIRNQGRPNSGTFIHDSFGMNFRITDMQACIGHHLLGYYENELTRGESCTNAIEKSLKI